MRGQAGVAGERGRLLGVHVRVGECLGVGAPPAVEVDLQRVLGLAEQLAPAPRALRRRLDAALHRGPERALEVEAEGACVRDVLALLAVPPPPDREHEPAARPARALPPIA